MPSAPCFSGNVALGLSSPCSVRVDSGREIRIQWCLMYIAHYTQSGGQWICKPICRQTPASHAWWWCPGIEAKWAQRLPKKSFQKEGKKTFHNLEALISTLSFGWASTWAERQNREKHSHCSQEITTFGVAFLAIWALFVLSSIAMYLLSTMCVAPETKRIFIPFRAT